MDRTRILWKPVERPAAVASGVWREGIVVRQKREDLKDRKASGPNMFQTGTRAVSGNRDADTTASRGRN